MFRRVSYYKKSEASVRLSEPRYFLAPCDKRKHTGHAHQQAGSQASTDSAWRHPVWLPHSSLDLRSITQTDATSHNRAKWLVVCESRRQVLL